MENNYTITNMNEEYARQIASWFYEGEYSDYNLPSYEEMVEKKYGMTNPDKKDNYICYIKDNEVVAYISMKEVEDKIFFGIGIKPIYCGNGNGNFFIKHGLNEIKNKYKDKEIFLEVRSHNKRAIRSYEKNDFIITKYETKKDRLGNEVEFVEMKYNL